MMRNLFLIIFALSTTPAFAQDTQPNEAVAQVVTTAETCTSSAMDIAARSACVGKAAAQCVEASETPNTITQSECAGAELDYWNTYLTTSYDELHAALAKSDAENTASGAATQADALEATHAAWLSWRDTECAYAASRMGGGSGAGPAETGCQMMMTGHRAIQVEAELAGTTQE